jgi:uncharacterized membrane protein
MSTTHDKAISTMSQELPSSGQGAAQRDPMEHLGFAPTIEPDGSMHWTLQRPCSMTPGQLLIALVLIALPSVIVALGFLWQGAAWISVFNGLELVILAAAFLRYAHTAGDAEWIRISKEHVEVQVRTGSSQAEQRFQRAFVTLTLSQDRSNTLALQESGRSITLGRHLPRHLRQDFYRMLRAALKSAWPP